MNVMVLKMYTSPDKISPLLLRVRLICKGICMWFLNSSELRTNTHLVSSFHGDPIMMEPRCQKQEIVISNMCTCGISHDNKQSVGTYNRYIHIHLVVRLTV